MFLNFLWAFIIGGLLCVIAQILIDKTNLTPARILVAYVCAGVFLTAIGFYQPLVDLAGCGATTPLSGFGYSIAKGIQKAISEKGAIGILTGGLSATSAGITLSIVMGLLMAVLFKSKSK
ncbi:MAG: stage V sporulation protein AE [Clostridiales bacterium]|nr:stage V sporulation protein AE [Clostridiales bacterium]